MVKIDLLFPFLRLILTRKAHHTPPRWSLEWPGSIDDAPEVLDWIQVWGMDRSVNSYNSFVIPPATSWDRKNSEVTGPTVGLMISFQTGTLEIHATLQRYALSSATHHQTWPTGNCSRHQIILHRVSRLSHVCSVWTSCHLWRDQAASGKSAKSAVLQGDVAEGCQQSAQVPTSRYQALLPPFLLVSDGLGGNLHRSSMSEVTLWGFGSASHAQCNSVAVAAPRQPATL